jgi:hypothetical protein
MQDGHKYDAFIKGDFQFENNSSNLNEERKTYSASITIEVIGYLIGDDKNQISPKMTRRENAVEVKIPREMSKKLGRLLGYMCSDGSVGVSGINLSQQKNNVCFDFEEIVGELLEMSNFSEESRFSVKKS